MHLDLLNKFTVHLQNALSRAIDLAWELRQESIPPLFLLISLYEQTDSIGAQLLQNHKVAIKIIAGKLPAAKKSSATPPARPQPPAPPAASSASGGQFSFLWPEFAPQTKKIIEYAARTAYEFQHQYIGTEHLLYAILQQPDQDILQIVRETKIPVEKIKRELQQIIKTMALSLEEPQQLPQQAAARSATTATITAKNPRIAPTPTETPALDFFGTDLTADEQLKKLDPVIGRADEIQRLIHILLRRTKNNPVLIGDAGVGKTAIVEGLAKKIAAHDVPDVLLGKKIVALDLSLVIAGTMYRGEFESRLRQIIEELKTNPDIILFIDEMHNLVGAGETGNNSTMDAANILKPALAKGEVRCIGATTIDEYHRHIETDAALERRFQPVIVREPSLAETEQILYGLRGYYEKFHHITIADEAIRSAVQLAARYIPEKRLPDKAIDLLDEAGAKVVTERPVPEAIKKIQHYYRLLQKLRQRKEDAVRSEQFNLAVTLKDREQKILQKCEALEKQMPLLNTPPTPLGTKDIARVAVAMTGVPLEQMISTTKQFSTNANLEKDIRARLIGQDKIVAQVCAVIRRSLANLHVPRKPLGSFLFLGPSGVGKTELAKVLAETHYGRADALVRVDMSEFAEGFHVAKLLGAPAGYVGYNETVKFVDKIRRQPYSVVLFDELEKAHPDVFNILLQILDEGRLTDAKGRELNFCNTVIIMTSNIGIELLNKQAEIGFAANTASAATSIATSTAAGTKNKTRGTDFTNMAETIMAELREALPLELLNRINHTLVFQPLTIKDIEKIVELHFQTIRERLQERGIKTQLLPTARQFMAQQSFSPEQGARLVPKKSAELIADPLADKIMAGELRRGDSVKIKVVGKKIAFVKE